MQLILAAKVRETGTLAAIYHGFDDKSTARYGRWHNNRKFVRRAHQTTKRRGLSEISPQPLTIQERSYIHCFG